MTTTQPSRRLAHLTRTAAGPNPAKGLPVREHPIPLYSPGVPNGVTSSVMPEELVGLGYSGAAFECWLIKPRQGYTFS